MRPRPVPEDFLEHAICEGQTALAARYRVDASRIHYWLEQQPEAWLKQRFRNLRLRPAPADLERRYMTMKRDELLVYYKCGDSTLARWLKEAGIKRKPSYFASLKKSLPANLAELAHGKNLRELAKIIGMTSEYLGHRLQQEAPAVYEHCRANSRRQKPIPDDFAEVGMMLSTSRLAAHYKTGESTIKRWCQMMPLEWQRERAAGMQKRSATLNKPAHSRAKMTWAPVARIPEAAGDMASQAARYLQRFYSNVFNVGKVYGKKALEDTYAVGTLRMHRDDMIALAEERGFDINAWRKVAA